MHGHYAYLFNFFSIILERAFEGEVVQQKAKIFFANPKLEKEPTYYSPVAITRA